MRSSVSVGIGIWEYPEVRYVDFLQKFRYFDSFQPLNVFLVLFPQVTPGRCPGPATTRASTTTGGSLTTTPSTRTGARIPGKIIPGKTIPALPTDPPALCSARKIISTNNSAAPRPGSGNSAGITGVPLPKTGNTGVQLPKTGNTGTLLLTTGSTDTKTGNTGGRGTMGAWHLTSRTTAPRIPGKAAGHTNLILAPRIF